MLTSMAPVGENARGQRWWVTATAHLVGAVTGGAVTGALAGTLGSVVVGGTSATWRLAALAGAAAIGIALDRAGRLPVRRRQVDERWLNRYRGWVYGGGFGLQLGAGVLTTVPVSTTYVAFLGAALTARPATGAVVGATFGAVRALPLFATRGLRTAQALRERYSRHELAEPRATLATHALQGAAAVAAFTAAVLTGG